MSSYFNINTRKNFLMEEIIKFYKESCNKFGSVGWQAAHWASEENQFLRFSLLDKYLEIKDGTLLDVGCGQGELYSYIKTKNIDYLGIDFCPEMIEIARVKYPDANFVLGDFLEVDFGKQFDYVIVSGSISLIVENQDGYIENILKKIFDVAFKKIGATLLSNEKSYEYINHYFYNPKEIISICPTNRIILDNNSLPPEMLLFMFKN